MPAVLESTQEQVVPPGIAQKTFQESPPSVVPTTFSPGVANVPETPKSAWLKPYHFQPGQPGGPGRPKGSKNRITPQQIFQRKELRITKHYTDRATKSDPVLIDAMKRILPVADEASTRTPMIVVVVSDAAMPRALTVPADDTLRVSASENQPALPATHVNSDGAR